MYGEDVYNTFCQLRKQLYKLKTTKGADKYSKIEMYQREYVTFRRFCGACEDYFSWRYRDEVTEETIQEVFDQCLEWSQQKCLKITLIGY